MLLSMYQGVHLLSSLYLMLIRGAKGVQFEGRLSTRLVYSVTFVYLHSFILARIDYVILSTDLFEGRWGYGIRGEAVEAGEDILSSSTIPLTLLLLS